ncbi:MAG: TolC family protein [Proteobacteria bacterium]|nr:TolC family protein [Pseudomonadota bacterium]
MRESSAQSQAARAAIQTRQALQNLISLLGPQPDLESLQKEIKILSQRILPFPTQTPELGNEKVLSFDEKNAVTLQKRAELSLEQSYRLRFLPQIDFVGILTQTQNKSWLDESSEAKTKRRNYDSNLQLQVTWNLWDRSQDFRIQAAVAEKTAALAQADSSRYQVQNEAVRLQNYILDLHKSLSIAKEAYVRAGQLYDAQLRLFETGVIGIQALVDSERERRSAITAWHETVYELQLNILQWQSFQRGFLGGLGTKSES